MGAESGGVLNPAGWIFLALDGWSLLYLAGCRRYSGVGVLENALPLGNNTTTHSFQIHPTHMCTFLSVIAENKRKLCPEIGILWVTKTRLVSFRCLKKSHCTAKQRWEWDVQRHGFSFIGNLYLNNFVPHILTDMFLFSIPTFQSRLLTVSSSVFNESVGLFCIRLHWTF